MEGISNTNQQLNAQERATVIESLNLPPRILYDYNLWDKETYKIALLLHPYDGFRKFACKLVERLVTLYTLILRFKHS